MNYLNLLSEMFCFLMSQFENLVVDCFEWTQCYPFSIHQVVSVYGYTLDCINVFKAQD